MNQERELILELRDTELVHLPEIVRCFGILPRRLDVSQLYYPFELVVSDCRCEWLDVGQEIAVPCTEVSPVLRGAVWHVLAFRLQAVMHTFFPGSRVDDSSTLTTTLIYG